MKKPYRKLGILVFLSGLIATLFVFLPTLSYENFELAGYEIIVGGEIFNLNPFDLGSVASAHIPFSPMGAAAFSLPLIAGLVVLFKPHHMIISTSLFIISVFLFITLPNSVEIVTTIAGVEEVSSVEWNREAGYIGGLSASVIGALLSILGVLKHS